MATILAHIEIKPGTESQWESIMADMVSQTFAHEERVLRYEYFKGQSPLHYYCLLSFEDKWAFYLHQASDYHECHDFESVLANVELEYLDPVKGASDLDTHQIIIKKRYFFRTLEEKFLVLTRWFHNM